MILTSLWWYAVIHLVRNIAPRLSPKRSEAIGDCVMRLFPHDEAAMVLKLIGLYEQDRPKDALSFSDEILKFYKDNGVVYGIRGDLFVAQNDNESALAAYNNVLIRYPHSTTAMLHKASLLSTMGHIDTAISCYDDIIDQNNSSSEDSFFAYLAKGTLLLQAGRMSELERFCNMLVESHKNAPSILSMVGAFYFQSGQTDKGLMYYRQALDSAKSNPAMFNKLTSIIEDAERDGSSRTRTSV